MIITDEKPTTNPITIFAQRTLLLIILALMGAMLALSIATPDHVSGKTSNDAGWVK